MSPRLIERLSTLSASLWFRPSLMVAGSMLLFAGVWWADLHTGAEHLPGWILAANHEATRSLLTAIVQSVVGVAGVTFSVTMAALIMATAQYGPRLLREFTGDRGSQRVLGVFMGTAVFSMLTLRTIDEGSPLPHLTVATATALGLTSFVALIYFIHRMALAIQVDDLASRVAAEYLATLDRLVPEEPPPEAGEESHPPAEEVPDGDPVCAEEMGYVQAIDEGALVEVARRAEGHLTLARRPGQLVLPGLPLAFPSGGTGWDDEARARVRGAFHIGAQRSPAQDLLLSMHQLLEVALRALSPAMNDPFVARAAIDRLVNGLALLVSRPRPRRHLRDGEGRTRVVRDPVGFQDALEDAMDHLRPDASRNLTVSLHLLEVLETLGTRTIRTGDRAAVRRQVALLEAAATRQLQEAVDRQRVRALARQVQTALRS